MEIVSSTEARTELLNWLNAQLPDNVSPIRKVEDCGRGVPYVALLPYLFPSEAGRLASSSRVKLQAAHEFEAASNLKVLQDVLQKHNIGRPPSLEDPHKLIKGNFQANLALLQWFKGFVDAVKERRERQEEAIVAANAFSGIGACASSGAPVSSAGGTSRTAPASSEEVPASPSTSRLTVVEAPALPSTTTYGNEKALLRRPSKSSTSGRHQSSSHRTTHNTTSSTSAVHSSQSLHSTSAGWSAISGSPLGKVPSTMGSGTDIGGGAPVPSVVKGRRDISTKRSSASLDGTALLSAMTASNATGTSGIGGGTSPSAMSATSTDKGKKKKGVGAIGHEAGRRGGGVVGRGGSGGGGAALAMTRASSLSHSSPTELLPGTVVEVGEEVAPSRTASSVVGNLLHKGGRPGTITRGARRGSSTGTTSGSTTLLRPTTVGGGAGTRRGGGERNATVPSPDGSTTTTMTSHLMESHREASGGGGGGAIGERGRRRGSGTAVLPASLPTSSGESTIGKGAQTSTSTAETMTTSLRGGAPLTAPSGSTAMKTTTHPSTSLSSSATSKATGKGKPSGKNTPPTTERITRKKDAEKEEGGAGRSAPSTVMFTRRSSGPKATTHPTVPITTGTGVAKSISISHLDETRYKAPHSPLLGRWTLAKGISTEGVGALLDTAGKDKGEHASVTPSSSLTSVALVPPFTPADGDGGEKMEEELERGERNPIPNTRRVDPTTLATNSTHTTATPGKGELSGSSLRSTTPRGTTVQSGLPRGGGTQRGVAMPSGNRETSRKTGTNALSSTGSAPPPSTIANRSGVGVPLNGPVSTAWDEKTVREEEMEMTEEDPLHIDTPPSKGFPGDRSGAQVERLGGAGQLHRTTRGGTQVSEGRGLGPAGQGGPSSTGTVTDHHVGSPTGIANTRTTTTTTATSSHRNPSSSSGGGRSTWIGKNTVGNALPTSSHASHARGTTHTPQVSTPRSPFSSTLSSQTGCPVSRAAGGKELPPGKHSTRSKNGEGEKGSETMTIPPVPPGDLLFVPSVDLTDEEAIEEVLELAARERQFFYDKLRMIERLVANIAAKDLRGADVAAVALARSIRDVLYATN